MYIKTGHLKFAVLCAFVATVLWLWWWVFSDNSTKVSTVMTKEEQDIFYKDNNLVGIVSDDNPQLIYYNNNKNDFNGPDYQIFFFAVYFTVLTVLHIIFAFDIAGKAATHFQSNGSNIVVGYILVALVGSLWIHYKMLDDTTIHYKDNKYDVYNVKTKAKSSAENKNVTFYFAIIFSILLVPWLRSYWKSSRGTLTEQLLRNRF